MSQSDLALLAALFLVVVLAAGLLVLWLQQQFNRIKHALDRAPATLELAIEEPPPVVIPPFQERQALWQTLTRREKKVCRLAARGLSNPEIADELDLVLQTVKSHLRSSYHKLGLVSRHELKYFIDDLVDDPAPAQDND